MIDYDIVSTGSKGNCLIINEKLMIDCGVSYKKFAPHVKGLILVLLTHIHGDHFNSAAIKKLISARPSIRFGCGPWLVGPLLECGVSRRRIDVLEEGNVYSYSFGDVIPFHLVHDVPNQGYKVHLSSGERFLYATDTSNIDHVRAYDYDMYFVEANYTESDMQARIDSKEASGEYVYEYRARKVHMSMERCNMWLLNNMGPKSDYVYIHQHEDDKDEGKD